MLKLEHINFHRRLDKIYISFANHQDGEIIKKSNELTELFRDAVINHWKREELEEWLTATIRQSKKNKFSAGAAKLLSDRSEFEETMPDLPVLRRKVLLSSTEAMHQAGGDYRKYRDIIRTQNVPENIYGDLPGFATIKSCRNFSSAGELICAYNLAQIQGILLYASKVNITLITPQTEELRPLFRSLRFHRLLASAVNISPESTTLEIDGPFSILESSRKYAMQLANFFPAVTAFNEWKLAATIKNKDRNLRLELNSKDISNCILKKKNKDYIPPEFSLFQKSFQSQEWEIADDVPAFIPDVDSQIIPDITFRNKIDGQIVNLELFHRWHRYGATKRLLNLEKLKTCNLIIGIDRSIGTITEEYPEAKKSGLVFLFRDFPGVESVLRTLKNFRAATKHQ